MARNIAMPRVNIYLPNSVIRRQIKTAAARQDVSVSEYCLRAITTQLIKDGERPPGPAQRRREATVAAARRFQTEAFAGRVFAMSSADLIREAREDR